MGIGVERVDYTKGIIERFRGLERFLEKYPAYRGQLHPCADRRAQPDPHQALSRSHWEKSRRRRPASIGASRRTTGSRSSTCSGSTRHHEILPYYKAADLCLVTSLHDGMNLVAKEFVAARDDDQGALILSRFAGASHELRDALIVNPYDTEQLADAMHFALEMDPSERSSRMQPPAARGEGVQYLSLGGRFDFRTL